MKRLGKILIISLILNIIFITSIFATIYQERIEVLRDKTVSMYFNGHKLSLVDSNTGEKYYPLLYKDRTYIPVRAFLNVVGVEVDWDEDNNLVLFETNYDIKTGRENRYLGSWYKEQIYNELMEEELEKKELGEKEVIPTVYYSVDHDLFHIPIVQNVHVKNKTEAIYETEWLGDSKEFLNQYIFISKPLVLTEKQYNSGHDLNLFYEKFRQVLREHGFSMLEEGKTEKGYERKFVKGNMNLFVIQGTDNITLKMIKGTFVDR